MHRACRKYSILLTCGVLICLAVGVVAEEKISGQVVMRIGSSTSAGPEFDPWLIPAELLKAPRETWASEDREQVPMAILAEIDSFLDRVRKNGRSGVCTPGEGVGGTPDERIGVRKSSLVEVAGDSKNVVIGEILRTEPAFDVRTRQAATLVHLRVQQVVRAVDSLAVGDIVTYRRPWGSFEIQGITLCSYVDLGPEDRRYSGQTAPVERLRQRVLLMGRIQEGNKAFFASNRFEEFQIVGDSVYYPRGFGYYPDKPESLSAVVHELTGGKPESRSIAWV